jgi:hypothetical protein
MTLEIRSPYREDHIIFIIRHRQCRPFPIFECLPVLPAVAPKSCYNIR